MLDALRTGHPQLYDRVVEPGRPGHGMLDLQQANRLMLIDAGVPADHIEVLRLCTSCHPGLLFSERREGRPTGRFGAVIALA